MRGNATTREVNSTTCVSSIPVLDKTSHINWQYRAIFQRGPHFLNPPCCSTRTTQKQPRLAEPLHTIGSLSSSLPARDPLLSRWPWRWSPSPGNPATRGQRLIRLAISPDWDYDKLTRCSTASALGPSIDLWRQAPPTATNAIARPARASRSNTAGLVTERETRGAPRGASRSPIQRPL